MELDDTETTRLGRTKSLYIALFVVCIPGSVWLAHFTATFGACALAAAPLWLVGIVEAFQPVCFRLRFLATSRKFRAASSEFKITAFRLPLTCLRVSRIPCRRRRQSRQASVLDKHLRHVRSGVPSGCLLSPRSASAASTWLLRTLAECDNDWCFGNHCCCLFLLHNPATSLSFSFVGNMNTRSTIPYDDGERSAGVSAIPHCHLLLAVIP